MANTKIPSELSSTPSISDSGTANAITITSGNVVQTDRAIQSTHNQAIRINGYGTLGQTSSGQMTVLGHNVETSATTNNTFTTINGSWYGHAIRLYYDEGISFHTTDSTVDADTTIFGASTNPYERMRLLPNGTLVLGDPAGNTSKTGSLRLSGRGDSSSGEVHVGSIFAHHANADSNVARIKFDGSSTSGNIQFQTKASGSLSEAMRILGDGDISIGTTSNNSQLHVVSDESAICTFEGSNSTGVVINSNSGVCSIIGYDRGAGAYNDVEIRARSGTQIYLDGSANSMGIGTTSPNSANLLQVGSTSFGGYPYRHVNGTGSYYMGHGNGSYHHHFESGASVGFYWGSACYAQGGFSTYSDERLKENITTIDGALDKVALMNGVTFNWIDPAARGSGDAGKQFGVTAQNMLEVDAELPKLVEDAEASQEDIDNEDIDTQYYSMDYSRLTPFFIEAIKELKTKLEAAEARITELEG